MHSRERQGRTYTPLSTCERKMTEMSCELIKNDAVKEVQRDVPQKIHLREF
jgi:hypothetical protein